MKQKIIIKNKIQWQWLNPFVWFIVFIVSFSIGLVVLISSFIPMLNIYVFNKLCRESDKERAEADNPLIKEVKYRIVKQTKVTEEVLQKIN